MQQMTNNKTSNSKINFDVMYSIQRVKYCKMFKWKFEVETLISVDGYYNIKSIKINTKLGIN